MAPVNKETPIALNGTPKESLLYDHSWCAWSDDERRDIDERLNQWIAKFDFTIEERTLAIIGAVILENELDDFLSHWITGYAKLKNRIDFTFSLKIELAKSLHLVPPKIIDGMTPIRKIRNLFAHQLALNTFEDARQYASETDNHCFETLYKSIDEFSRWDDRLDRNAFRHLILCIVLGLNVFKKQLGKLQDYIGDPDNLRKIIKGEAG